MNILIVQDNAALGRVWANHLDRLEAHTTLTASVDEAVNQILVHRFDVVVINLVLQGGSAFSIADVVYLHQPTVNVIFVTDTSFFSDGSIFAHVANARAMLETATPPEDLAAIVHHYAQDASHAREALQNQVPDSSG